MALLTANNQSMTAITALPSAVAKGGLVLLATETASSSATISFTSNIDSTYKEYIFKFTNIHPATDSANLSFNMSIDAGSNYNVTKTTTSFRSVQTEDATTTALGYRSDYDLAQATGFQPLGDANSNDNDSALAGELYLFNPSSTTFVKHFTAVTSHIAGQAKEYFTAGYGNTTSAVDAIQFKMSSGNIDAGTFKLYGVT